MNEIVVHPSHISITNYELGEAKEVEGKYSYIENWKKHTTGITYDEKTKELRVVGGNPYYLKYLTSLPVRYQYMFDDYAKMSLKLQNSPRNTLQTKIIQFLIGEGEYKDNKEATQLVCNAETGEGKTFCAIATMSFLKLKTIIIVNRVVIEDNWYNEIKKFTDASDENICILDTNTIEDIVSGKKNTKKIAVYIVIHRTLHFYFNENGWDRLPEVFGKMGIGLKIYDEAHREFANTTMVDCYSNTKKTLYLTATLRLSSPQANLIYQYIFKYIPKFNQVALGYTDAKKHIICIAYIYNSHPAMEDIKKCYNARLHYFNAKNHSIYQITNDNKFFEILTANINKFIIANKFRGLILVSRIKACDEIANFIIENIPGIKVGVYNSSINSKVKKKVLQESDLIISTNSSLGESVTIDKLRFVLNCEAHRNYGDQASGRLRKFKNNPDTTCYYCELVDIGFNSILKQWNSRKYHYGKIFKGVYEIKC